MSPRRRPLHTCGVAILSTGYIVCTRSQDLGGPLGSMTRKISRLTEFASPLIFSLLYQWLAILSFADDLILAAENGVETILPPSNYLFNKIDKLVQMAETLPEKIDDAIRELPKNVDQYSLADCAVIHVTSWIKFWISIFIHWESGHAHKKEFIIDSSSKEFNTEPPSTNQPVESSTQVDSLSKPKLPHERQSSECRHAQDKEFMIDSNSKKCNTETPSTNQSAESSAQVSILSKRKLPHEPQLSESETDDVSIMPKRNVRKISYKEVLEKGTRESTRKEANSSKNGRKRINGSKKEKRAKENLGEKDDANMAESRKHDIRKEEAERGGEMGASTSNETITK